MLLMLAVVVGLVAWALHLMQCAIDQREFSLMLAGLLVSSAAAGLVGVYFLMSNCMSYYMTEVPRASYYTNQSSDYRVWSGDAPLSSDPYPVIDMEGIAGRR